MKKNYFWGVFLIFGGCLSGCEPAWIPSGSRRIFTVVYRCMHRRDCGEYPTCSLLAEFYFHLRLSQLFTINRLESQLSRHGRFYWQPSLTIGLH